MVIPKYRNLIIKTNSKHGPLLSRLFIFIMVKILHVSSLIHDDILDESQFRRGIKTLHTVLGKKHATFTGNYMIGRAYIISL